MSRRTLPPAALPFAPRAASRATVLAAALVAAALTSPAARAEPADGLLELLKDKGLVPAAADQARQVRDAAADLVIKAMNYVGVRYRRGGTSADEGFDCSGFTRYVFEATTGLLLPRRADQQAASAGLVNIDQHELRPGDLVFFNTMRRAFSHVGIYVGGGRFIHAPRTGAAIRIEDMRVAYWSKRFNGARRADAAGPAAPAAPAAPATDVPQAQPQAADAEPRV
jgi:cell wall-associated NlpC family hydrolase